MKIEILYFFKKLLETKNESINILQNIKVLGYNKSYFYTATSFFKSNNQKGEL